MEDIGTAVGITSTRFYNHFAVESDMSVAALTTVHIATARRARVRRSGARDVRPPQEPEPALPWRQPEKSFIQLQYPRFCPVEHLGRLVDQTLCRLNAMITSSWSELTRSRESQSTTLLPTLAEHGSPGQHPDSGPRGTVVAHLSDANAERLRGSLREFRLGKAHQQPEQARHSSAPNRSTSSGEAGQIRAWATDTATSYG